MRESEASSTGKQCRTVLQNYAALCSRAAMNATLRRRVAASIRHYESEDRAQKSRN
jgi:hypothetical protein